eukprot:3078274-Prymnesium_polylepis.1
MDFGGEPPSAQYFSKTVRAFFTPGAPGRRAAMATVRRVAWRLDDDGDDQQMEQTPCGSTKVLRSENYKFKEGAAREQPTSRRLFVTSAWR